MSTPGSTTAAATASPAAPWPDPVPRAAFSAGWLIAQLHGPILGQSDDSTVALPAINELGRSARITLAFERLTVLLHHSLAVALTPLAGQEPLTTEPLKVAWGQARLEDIAALRTAIESFHVELLTRLTVTDRRYGTAYSLGRSLSDTCWLPTTLVEVERRFVKSRLSNLQSWLADLSSSLPELSADAVAQGLDHWAVWLQVHTELGSTDEAKVIAALQAQGEHWRSLLAGEQDPASLLSPEAYVQAGEAALHRAGIIVRREAAHFWWVLLVVVLAVAGAIFVALRYAEGAAKLWGTGVSLLAGVGVTGTTLRATATRLTTEAGHTLFNLEEADAVGWAATWLPPITPSPAQKRQLRKAGVAPPRA